MSKANSRVVLRFFLRLLVVWAIETAGLLLVAWLLPSVYINNLGAAIAAAAAIGALNALLWPFLSAVLLPFAVLTLGLLSLALNGLLVWLAAFLIEGFEVTTIWAAIGLALGLAATNTILSTLLTIDDDASWYRGVLLRRIRRRTKDKLPASGGDVPGVLFLELDGLARPVLERAVREGHMPTLARWLQSGSHRLVSWETDLSSQTSASQAGILHGNNHNIPAFRWWDRGRQQIVSSSSPQEVARLEKEHSDGQGLLAREGASRGNLFSGDAPNVMVTASTITDTSRFHATDFYAYFASPYNLTRTLLLTLWDILLEIRQYRRARRQGAYPILDRKKRGGKYPILRSFTTVLMRELNIYTLIGDMYAGVPAAYATFVGYDEVAHHSGVEDAGAFDILRKLDQQLARLESAARQAPRRYKFVLLSDHGQSGGATFKQRYGLTLEQLIQKLAAENYRVQGDVDVHEDWKHVNVFLTEMVQYDRPALSRPLSQVLGENIRAGQVELGPEPDDGADQAREETNAIVVLASGNLGLVYFADFAERATLEALQVAYPGLLAGLLEHEGIGFLMIRSQTAGPVVLGARGTHYLQDGRVEGEDPLAGFGPHAAHHLRRTDSFPDAPDILVNSFYDPESNEVAAFEELIGSHGGLGGWQTEPFLLYPAEWQVPEAKIVGAEALYRVLKGWLDGLDSRQAADRLRSGREAS